MKGSLLQQLVMRNVSDDEGRFQVLFTPNRDKFKSLAVRDYFSEHL
jgi:hypothetical protein